MRFSIVKNKSGQVPPQSSCDFLPPGGTIGRSVDNNLVLPDEERAISACRRSCIFPLTANAASPTAATLPACC